MIPPAKGTLAAGSCWVCMRTAAQCLARAEENDALAKASPDGIMRDSYRCTADGWRRTALLARQQEVWAAAHSID